FVGRARQHAVFGSDPAAALALEPGRQPLFQRRGDQHMGVAERHEAGAFGVFDHAALERYGAKLVGLSATWPHIILLGRKFRPGFRGWSRKSQPRLAISTPAHSGWMPASLIILVHFTSWTLTKLSSSSAELEKASKPVAAIWAFTSGSSMILRSSAL